MMSTCVLIADHNRARLFDLNKTEDLRHSYELSETLDLVNRYPEIAYEARGQGSGTNAIRHGNQTFYSGYDHEEANRLAEDVKFAKEIVQELRQHLQNMKAQRLIRIATPKFLGTLRDCSPKFGDHGFEVKDLAKDLTGLSAVELRDYLEERELI